MPMPIDQLSLEALPPCTLAEIEAVARAWGIRHYPLDEHTSHVLRLSADGLSLRAQHQGKAESPLRVDFLTGPYAYRWQQTQHQKREHLPRAIGVKKNQSLSVLDATAGLGRDGFLLATLGCQVTLLESSKLVGALLADGLRRAAGLIEKKAWSIELIGIESSEYLHALAKGSLAHAAWPDVIYLDPMYAPAKKSAKVKQAMRLLSEVVGPDENSALLLQLSRSIAKKRVVVKRHRLAPPIDACLPDEQLIGNSTRFDIYWPKQHQ